MPCAFAYSFLSIFAPSERYSGYSRVKRTRHRRNGASLCGVVVAVLSRQCHGTVAALSRHGVASPPSGATPTQGSAASTRRPRGVDATTFAASTRDDHRRAPSSRPARPSAATRTAAALGGEDAEEAEEGVVESLKWEIARLEVGVLP